MEFYFQNGLANSSQRAYNSAKKRYKQFCSTIHTHPLPASELLLCRFTSHLASQKLRHGTIKAYLAGVRHLHISEGWGNPNINRMAKLEQVLKGIKSAQAKGQGPSKQTRLPVTLDILSKLRGVWQQVESGPMLWAAASLCFFGFLRSGEITIPSDTAYDEGAHLNFHDVAVDGLENPKMLRLRIKASKTDPFRVGVDIFVGRTGTPLCPVAALLIYMAERGEGQGPLFRFRDGRPLTRTRFVAKVKGALTTAGVDKLATLDIVSELGQRQQQRNKASVMQQSRCWEGGRVMPTNYILGPQENNWRQCHNNWCKGRRQLNRVAGTR